jgi:aspartate kinase
MNMIIMKFGGTSVGSAEKMKDVYNIVHSRKNRKPVVVASAVSGVTDLLIKAGTEAVKGNIMFSDIESKHMKIIDDLKLDRNIIDGELKDLKDILEVISKLKDFDKKLYDIIVSVGERMSTRILAAYFNKIGFPAKQYDAYEIGMITDNNFSEAEILPETYDEIKKKLTDFSKVPIVTGFIGKTKEGKITTLGRGGSDYTAAIIGAAIGAEEIQIWTDVNGVMTTDPKIVKHVTTIPVMSFAEASELAFFGAKVLHPKTILPAVKKDIPVMVLNTYEPDNKGTTIVSKITTTQKSVKAISCKKNVTLITISSTRMLNAHGFLAKVFEVFSENEVSVDMVSTSEVSISMTLDKSEKLDIIKSQLDKIAETEIITGKALICVIGENFKESVGTKGKIFTVLGHNKIKVHMISMGASDINIAFIVDEENREKSVQVLHKEFLE